MPTKSEIESRVSRIVQIFKSAMPGIPAPYHQTLSQLSQRTYRDTRALLVSQTGSAAVAAPTDAWIVELISGKRVSNPCTKGASEESGSLVSCALVYPGSFFLIAAQNGIPSDGKNISDSVHEGIFLGKNELPGPAGKAGDFSQ